jgi:hypothetical protein
MKEIDTIAMGIDAVIVVLDAETDFEAKNVLIVAVIFLIFLYFFADLVINLTKKEKNKQFKEKKRGHKIPFIRLFLL